MGDIDGDGDGDLVLQAEGDKPVLWGGPSGLSDDGTVIPSVGYGLDIADLDGDGDNEVLAQPTATSVAAYSWNGSGFGQSPLFTIGAVSNLTAADLAGDYLEIVTDRDDVAVHHEGPGGWTTTTLCCAGDFLRGLALGDVDGDGDTDVVTAAYDGIQFVHAQVFLQGASGLIPGELTEVPYGGGLAAGDLDGDGTDELIWSRAGSAQPYLYSVRNGTLRWEQVLEVERVDGDDLRVVKVDGDGLDDILLASTRRALLTVHGDPSVSVPEGPGTVRSTAPSNVADSVAVTANVTVQCYRDLNPGSVNGSSVWLMEGRSGQTVSAAVTFNSASDAITLNPSASLLPSTVYTLVVAGVTSPAGAMPLLLVGFRTAAGPMPLIAVNGTYTPVVGEFNVDGANDLFWYANGGTDARGSEAPLGSAGFGNFPGWPAGMRPLLLDFDGDGFDNFLVYTPGTVNGSDYMIPGGPGQGDLIKGYFQQTASLIPLGGDFDGDGYEDLFWYGPGTTKDEIWYGAPTSPAPWRKVIVTVNGTYPTGCRRLQRRPVRRHLLARTRRLRRRLDVERRTGWLHEDPVLGERLLHREGRRLRRQRLRRRSVLRRRRRRRLVLALQQDRTHDSAGDDHPDLPPRQRGLRRGRLRRRHVLRTRHSNRQMLPGWGTPTGAKAL